MSDALRFLCPAAILIVGAGCGSGHYPVSGRVAFPDGKPLAGGTIEFRPTDEVKQNRTLQGTVQLDGTFQLAMGAVEGPYRVIVVAKMDPKIGDAPGPLKLPLDSKYQEYDRSGLTATVERKANEFVFTVKKPGG